MLTVDEYIESLDNSRKQSISDLRKVIVANLPDGYEETMQYGMISYIIPFSRYPDTYNKQPLTYISLASQKNYMSLYLMCVYGGSETTFRKAFEAAGKKLDMGKSCVRFKQIDDLPLDVIAETVAMTSVDEYIAMHERSREGTT